ncbi:MAG: FkbM family methyltransferase [Acidimicrobiia bacterium]|nr:FkbM family methyltransferase [Acidimicrobiia bacterium]
MSLVDAFILRWRKARRDTHVRRKRLERRTEQAAVPTRLPDAAPPPPPPPPLLDERRRLWEKEVVTRLRHAEHQMAALTSLVEGIARKQQSEGKWRARARLQLDALIRQRFVESRLPAEGRLEARRFLLHSQNEEDGITLALLEAVGTTSRTFVDIGCGTTGGNAAVLAFDFGWRGLMVDSNPRATTALRGLIGANPAVSFVCTFVTSANVNDLLREHGMAGEIDLLSIDIDGADYWVLNAIDVCRPRVMVLEYNASFGPVRAVTVPDGPLPEGAPKGYSGASLAALEQLARRKGYRLVVCEPAGVNAFFVRSDLAPEIPGRTAAEAYRAWVDRRAIGDLKTRTINVYKLAASQGLPLVDV